MKPTLLTALLLAGLPVLAQETAPPPNPQRFTIRIAAPEKQKVTWLGLQASAASEATRKAAGLDRVGLTVDHVNPKSPAATAGVTTGDLLHKLDDQILVNFSQVLALIRSHKPGDAITLSIVRDGKPMKLEVVLAETETWEAPAPPPGAPAGLPRDVILFDPALPVPPNPGGVPQRIFIRAHANQVQTTWSDGKHSVSLERQEGVTKRAIVVDLATGKQIFNGPLETPEQRKALPADIADKITKAEAAGAVEPQVNWNDNVMFIRGGGLVGGAGGSQVKTWQDDQHLLVMRVAQSPTYLLAISKKDGRTLFDGPVSTDEHRRAIPPEVADKFQALVNKPDLMKEFGK